MKISVVTATTNPEKTKPYWSTWRKLGKLDWDLHVVWNGTTPEADRSTLALSLVDDVDSLQRNPSYLGTVAAFRLGVETALILDDPDLICCFHDDLELLAEGWDERLVNSWPHSSIGLVGLAGYGGALGVGRPGMYDKPFDPMTLARHDFRSNLVDAETHGKRVEIEQRVAVLDGFSLIFTREFLEKCKPWDYLNDLGIIHHVYDVAMGCLAKRHGFETWYLPEPCHHHGGQTAVGDPGYQKWAQTKFPDGDQGVWRSAHEIVWNEFKDVLPFSVDEL